jgi:hypothetical protein
MAWRLSTGLRNKQAGLFVEKITNGGFASVTTGWTAVAATLTSAASGQAGNCLSIAETGSSAPGQAYQDITTIIGRLYRLTLYFKKGTADAGIYMIGTTGDENAIYQSAALSDAAWTAYTTYFVATATTTRITLQSTDATAAETSFFDTVSVMDIAGSFQDVFKDCVIKVYSGSQPASANDAPSGTLLCTFYSDGAAAGLEWGDAAAGIISKAVAETWSGTAGNTGTAGWFRIQCLGDSAGSSTVEERLDGACATSGAEMNMSSTTITSGAVQTISAAALTFPAS